MRPSLDHLSVVTPLSRRPLIAILLSLAPLLPSCGLINLGGSSTLSIVGVPTGCGTKVDTFTTLSWIAKFTVNGAPAGANITWSFSDGTSGVGESVVKYFDTAAKESNPPGNPVTDEGEHAPVKFDVTVTAGSNSVTQQFEIPMRGTPDGGEDPFGDTCVTNENRTHVPSPTQAPPGTTICYANNPPASGPHWSVAASPNAPVAPGFYDQALATEQWVHNLEHGAVVLLYDCGGTCSQDLKDQLQALFDSLPASARFNEKKMVITRYAGIGAACTGTASFPASGPFLAIAWDVQRSFDTLDTVGITDFYNRHVDHGPEDEPIPAP